MTSNQINIIKELARALPIHYKLYVKEHPLMVGDRTRAFYKSIKKMPNVRLIRPHINSFEIVKKAKLVATINGTAGWEAILFKKPVIVFGESFFNPLSAVAYCTSLHDLPNIVKRQLELFNYNEQEITDFLTALIEDMAPVDMVHLWEHENDHNKIITDVEPLVNLLAKKLNLRSL